MGQNKFERVLFLDCSDILPGCVLFYPKLGKLKLCYRNACKCFGGVYVRYNAGEALSAELWKNGKGP